MFIDLYGTFVSVLILLVLWLFYRLNRLERFVLDLNEQFKVHESKDSRQEMDVADIIEKNVEEHA